MPLLQTSLEVQGWPSSQVVLSGLGVTVQPPEPSQTEVAWHIVGVQGLDVPPQAPEVQTSLEVQAWPSLQPVPSVLLPPSMQAGAPVEQDVVPFLQRLGLPVQETPAVQAMQVPALLQTMLVPQGVPGALIVLLLHTIVPVVQMVIPVKQGFGLVEHDWLAVQAPQLPLPSHTMLVPQVMPPILLLPSAQAIAPVEQE